MGCQEPPIRFRQDAALDCEVEKVEREIRKLGGQRPMDVGPPRDHRVRCQPADAEPRLGLRTKAPEAANSGRGQQSDTEQTYGL